MKTTTRFTGLLAFLCALFMLASTGAKAQCAKIENLSLCDAIVDIVIYKTSPNCTAICATISQVPIAINDSYKIDCRGCNFCNIEVTITFLSMPISPISVSMTSPGPQSLSPASCGTDFEYDATLNKFIIQ